MDISEIILELKRLLRHLDRITCTPGENLAEIAEIMTEVHRVASTGLASSALEMMLAEARETQRTQQRRALGLEAEPA
jgi:hypothetical protein